MSSFSTRRKTAVLPVSSPVWRAVLRRDRHYDGKFVYAAVTTSIYCRPSCPARTPRRRNTLIFRSARDAEKQGYIACLRCHPQCSLTPAETKVVAALRYIDLHSDQVITLKTLSHASGLSAHHLRETFKAFVGLSPKSFCDVRRLATFKALLKAGESISSACYEAGFGSSRSLYEKARQFLGMTPAAYQRGGRGVHIRFPICHSACGPVLIARTRIGVCAVLCGENGGALVNELSKEFSQAHIERESFVKGAMISAVDLEPLVLRLPTSLQARVVQAKLFNLSN
jgi:AraC family transcriptional regulator, regulatory protein of adaptative response / methylated-DNA-[protein]-cysteine methyltransferase